jgi:hypothetical protein
MLPQGRRLWCVDIEAPPAEQFELATTAAAAAGVAVEFLKYGVSAYDHHLASIASLPPSKCNPSTFVSTKWRGLHPAFYKKNAFGAWSLGQWLECSFQLLSGCCALLH